jgi:fructose-1,6-bisphosphatase I
MMSAIGKTLARHILEDQHTHAEHVGELPVLLEQVSYAAKILSREIRRAALVGQLGLAGETNVSGDAQKKLDLFGNSTVMEAFIESGLVAAIVSEELDEPRYVPGGSDRRYVICIDPLDGSSNSDHNGAVGTIFGIYRRVSTGLAERPGGGDDRSSPASARPDGSMEDVLRKGSEQVAAGYVMYGPSTVLVYTSGHGVNGFTLDPTIGSFLLSHPDIRCPARGSTYSANLGRHDEWHPNIRKVIDYWNSADPDTHRPYSLRYTGAMIADLHRILLEGGVFFYPPDARHPNGKLRLLYECAPLAFVVEQAGGRGSTGRERILDIQATDIHQRLPIVIGSTEDVALYERFLNA